MARSGAFKSKISLIILALTLSANVVHASPVGEVVDALLGELRAPVKTGPAKPEDIVALGQALVNAFAPISYDEEQEVEDAGNSSYVKFPSIRFGGLYGSDNENETQWLLDIEEVVRARNLIESDDEPAGEKDAGVSAAAYDPEFNEQVKNRLNRIARNSRRFYNQMARFWRRAARKFINNWPVQIRSIYLRRRSSLGGGTCSFDFYSKLNWKFLPLQWKPTGAQCQAIPKTRLSTAENRWCVVFRLFRHVNFTQCAPAEYWQQLLAGELIYINPANGATVIDVIKLARSGGLDFIIPLRSAFGQGGPLDILNYL